MSCLAMGAIPRSILFTLLFDNIRTESVSFYFSIHENTALNTKHHLIRSSNVKDMTLCARVCATQFNCYTAIYNFKENKCDLFEKRMEDISRAMVMEASKGCYLITKVRIYILV